jgi:hypothetical protein
MKGLILTDVSVDFTPNFTRIGMPLSCDIGIDLISARPLFAHEVAAAFVPFK